MYKNNSTSDSGCSSDDDDKDINSQYNCLNFTNDLEGRISIFKLESVL